MKKINAYTFRLSYDELCPNFTNEVEKMHQGVESFAPLFIRDRLKSGLEFVIIESESPNFTEMYDVYIREKDSFAMDSLGHICKTLDEITQILERDPARLFDYSMGEVWENGIEDYQKYLLESFRFSISECD